MTEIIVALASIYLIAGAAATANKLFGWRICPICAGVSGTWIWLLAADYRLTAALLMGGSVVGIAYQLEKRLPPERSPLFWKMAFIPMGFFAAYALAIGDLFVFLVAAGAAAIFALLFFRKPPKHGPESTKVKELEEKMKKCC